MGRLSAPIKVRKPRLPSIPSSSRYGYQAGLLTGNDYASLIRAIVSGAPGAPNAGDLQLAALKAEEKQREQENAVQRMINRRNYMAGTVDAQSRLSFLQTELAEINLGLSQTTTGTLKYYDLQKESNSLGEDVIKVSREVRDNARRAAKIRFEMRPNTESALQYLQELEKSFNAAQTTDELLDVSNNLAEGTKTYKRLQREDINLASKAEYEQTESSYRGSAAAQSGSSGSRTYASNGTINPLIKKYFPEAQWGNAQAVMMGESGGRSGAKGDDYPINGVRAASYGLFQIRALPGRPAPAQLVDPEFNVRYAAQMYKQQGWGPWTVARKLGIVGGGQVAGTVQGTGNEESYIAAANKRINTLQLLKQAAIESGDTIEASKIDIEISNFNDRATALVESQQKKFEVAGEKMVKAEGGYLKNVWQDGGEYGGKAFKGDRYFREVWMKNEESKRLGLDPQEYLTVKANLLKERTEELLARQDTLVESPWLKMGSKDASDILEDLRIAYEENDPVLRGLGKGASNALLLVEKQATQAGNWALLQKVNELGEGVIELVPAGLVKDGLHARDSSGIYYKKSFEKDQTGNFTGRAYIEKVDPLTGELKRYYSVEVTDDKGNIVNGNLATDSKGKVTSTDAAIGLWVSDDGVEFRSGQNYAEAAASSGFMDQDGKPDIRKYAENLIKDSRFRAIEETRVEAETKARFDLRASQGTEDLAKNFFTAKPTPVMDPSKTEAPVASPQASSMTQTGKSFGIAPQGVGSSSVDQFNMAFAKEMTDNKITQAVQKGTLKPAPVASFQKPPTSAAEIPSSAQLGLKPGIKLFSQAAPKPLVASAVKPVAPAPAPSVLRPTFTPQPPSSGYGSVNIGSQAGSGGFDLGNALGGIFGGVKKFFGW